MFFIAAWSIISIAIVAMDNLVGNFRASLRDQENYQLRLISLAEERDIQLDFQGKHKQI